MEGALCWRIRWQLQPLGGVEKKLDGKRNKVGRPGAAPRKQKPGKGVSGSERTRVFTVKGSSRNGACHCRRQAGEHAGSDDGSEKKRNPRITKRHAPVMDWTATRPPTSILRPPRRRPPDPLREETVRTDSMRQLHMNYACFPKAGDWLRASAGPPWQSLIGSDSSKWIQSQRQVPASPHHQVSTPTSPCLGVDSERDMQSPRSESFITLRF